MAAIEVVVDTAPHVVDGKIADSKAVDSKAIADGTSHENAQIELIVSTIRTEIAGKSFDKKKLYALIIAAIMTTAKLAIGDGAKKKELVMKAFEVVLKEQNGMADADREDILVMTNAGIDLLYYQKKDSKSCCC